MIDFNDIDVPNQIIKIAWFGDLNGVLSSAPDTEARINRGIDQMYEQSKYLQQ